MKKLLSLVMVLCAFTGFANASATKAIAEDAALVSPLLNGQEVPNVQVDTIDGKTTSLLKALEGQKTILFFYRGGWCPFCNTQMGQLQAIKPELKKLGYRIVGISTDSPAMLQSSLKEQKVDYALLSDFNSNVSQAFGLAYFASEKTTKRYVSRLDLENPLKTNANGEQRLVLPVPAVYLIDEKGLVTFSYVNPNFRVRLDPQVLITAAKVY